ncbi:MAG: DUF4329 domain-containing protein [Yoonia sp.]|jgi:hypothetical protein|nr:DUF4329 domain-containing protein [Yoonia sp.]
MRVSFLIFAVLFGQALPAQDAEELAIAQDVLTRLQPISFEKRREYCGYIGYDEKGQMIATPPVSGTQDSCSAPFPRNVAITASYHTHGDFDHGYFNEIPSDVDIEGDKKFYMNGYVSTPGGRLWFIDTQIMVTHQVCGVACLPSAPRFRKGAKGDVAESYTYEELLEKLDH